MNGREVRALRRAVRQEAERLMAPRALADVAIERARQTDLWGVQDHPLGVGPEHATPDMIEAIKRATESAFENGEGTWRHILAEEVIEFVGAENVQRAREEAVQVAAVAVAIVEAIDRTTRAGIALPTVQRVKSAGPDGEASQSEGEADPPAVDPSPLPEEDAAA